MNRKIIRIVTAVLLVGLIAAPFATQTEAKSKKKAAGTNTSAAALINAGLQPYIAPVPPVSNVGTQLCVDIGNLTPQKVRIGGSVYTVQGVNFVNQYRATGTTVTGSQLPYSRIITAGVPARTYLANAAAALGCAPGDAFEIEIGAFTNYGGYKVVDKLYDSMNYELYVVPCAGYTPQMLVLYPNGLIRMLNNYEFDTRYSQLVYQNGTRLYGIHTYIPKAVYMLVYVPQ